MFASFAVSLSPRLGPMWTWVVRRHACDANTEQNNDYFHVTSLHQSASEMRFLLTCTSCLKCTQIYRSIKTLLQTYTTHKIFQFRRYNHFSKLLKYTYMLTIYPLSSIGVELPPHVSYVHQMMCVTARDEYNTHKLTKADDISTNSTRSSHWQWQGVFLTGQILSWNM